MHFLMTSNFDYNDVLRFDSSRFSLSLSSIKKSTSIKRISMISVNFSSGIGKSKSS